MKGQHRSNGKQPVRRIHRWARKGLWAVGISMVVLNGLAAFHAYRFSHLGTESVERIKPPEELSTWERLTVLVAGAPQGRKAITETPNPPYIAHTIPSGVKLSAWFLPADSAIGNAALFHGYRSNKQALLDRGEWFRSMGYNALLVDFSSSGESEGEWCTIGYHEADQVQRSLQFLDSISPEVCKNTVVFGNSMGAAAVMRNASIHHRPTDRLILECPFNSLLETTKNRFESMGAPAFPAAHLLVFYGGLINGFNGFEHNPATYAEAIQQPALYLSGGKDDRVLPANLDQVVEAHAGPADRTWFETAGHEDYWMVDSTAWTQSVASFLRRAP